MYPSSFLGALVVVWRMVAELFSRLVCLRRFTRSFAVHYFRALVHQEVCGGLPGLHIMTVHSLTTPLQHWGSNSVKALSLHGGQRTKTCGTNGLQFGARVP